MKLYSAGFYTFVGSLFFFIFSWGFLPGLWILDGFKPVILSLTLVGLFVWGFFSLERLTVWAKKRSTLFIFSLALSAVSVLGILGAVNWLAVKFNHKKDLTQNKIYSLSEQTVKVLGSLKEDIKVSVWTTNIAKMSTNRDFKKFMADYVANSHGKFSVEYNNPVELRGEAEKAGIHKDNVIVIRAVGSGRESRVDSFSETKGEEQLTNAIFQAIKGSKKLVCFLSGHGQASISDTQPTGLSTLKGRLEDSAYQTREIVLATADSIPKECVVVINHGPKSDPAAQELEKLKQYIASPGAQYIHFVGPGSSAHWRNLTQAYGVTVKEDIVIDRAVNPPVFVATQNYAREEELVSNFKKPVIFPESSTIQIQSVKDSKAQVKKLVSSEAHTFAKTGALKNIKVLNQAAGDAKGPFVLGVLITEDKQGAAKASPLPVESDKKEKASNAILVLSSTLFAANGLLTQLGNEDFVLNAISYMAQDNELMAIRPKEIKQAKLELSEERLRAVYATVLMISGAFLLGAIVSSRRKVMVV